MNQEEITAVENHISNIPSIGAMYAPVLLKWLRVALRERDDYFCAHKLAEEELTGLRNRLRAFEELHEKSMNLIHEAAGIKRDGLAGILGWIAEKKG